MTRIVRLGGYSGEAIGTTAIVDLGSCTRGGDCTHHAHRVQNPPNPAHHTCGRQGLISKVVLNSLVAYKQDPCIHATSQQAWSVAAPKGVDGGRGGALILLPDGSTSTCKIVLSNLVLCTYTGT